MKIVFAGTPDFARVALQRLLDAGFTVPLVLTQPDRPAGRGMKLQASPVKQCALEHGIAVAQPRSLRLDGKYPEDAAAARDALVAAGADAMVVAAYGLILPQWVLDLPARGCLNIHASLLPRWRGAAPIHRAIEAGDAETGVTIMQMDAGLDTGDMLLIEKTAIGPRDTTATLHDRLADLGGRMVVQALQRAARGGLAATPQPAEGVTYAHKIEKAESAIDWALPAESIGRRIRAFDPFPGASTTLDGEAIKVWSYEIDSTMPANSMPCGQILSVNDAGVTVACGHGALRLTTLQRAGGKRLPVADFLRGFALAPGMVLGGGAPAGARE
ncbi:methionyl-tRNA formyltransferase [Acidovorax sp. SUPP2522]|uniref:methionyl-tRNA formyltransferase n=1 Tax=unclassified Acidovorax TaxID=2684926 RepID=UPI00234B3162|nr:MULTISPECIES: methionyl-tRNA formyltransferase [unclassified Acidovorax]WCM98005.1 methionyl-tRNA formyltransferase [Acidovorax sp. GBBC 1281]GKT17475.1 methionyl-tRNA formyltransferase [Acidovorax sp. SUPP2522]